MNPRAFLFDLDGVLVNTKKAWYQLVCLTAREFRKPDIELQSFESGWGQGIEADLRTFFPGCSRTQIEAFYLEHLLDFDEDIVREPEAIESLTALRAQNIPRGVITNTPTNLARDILAATGLIGLIDITVGASSTVRSKPAPDTILTACQALQVPASDVLVVGDSRFDAEAALAAQAAFAGYAPHGDSRELGPRLLRRLSEVVQLVAPEQRIP